MRTAAHISRPEHARHAAKRTKSTAVRKDGRFRGAEHDLRALTRTVYGMPEPTDDELSLAETELESLEDPLDDWSENGSDADDWLRSHGVRFDEGRDA